MISREEAIELLEQKQKKLMTIYQRYLEDGGEPLQEHENWLYALNMAVEKYKQPERPKGRWDPISADRVRCTNCDAIRDITTQLFWDSCPNCGADMREIENEQESYRTEIWQTDRG